MVAAEVEIFEILPRSKGGEGTSAPLKLHYRTYILAILLLTFTYTKRSRYLPSIYIDWPF